MIGDLWLFDTLDCNGKHTMHTMHPHPPPPRPLPPPATEYQNKLGSGHSIPGGREDPALRSGNVWLYNLLSLLG